MNTPQPPPPPLTPEIETEARASQLQVRRNAREVKNYQSILNAAESFWLRVEKTDGCWRWTGAKIINGYGQFSASGIHYVAHRISWILTHGLPGFKSVCHKCDNRICVNPAHLFLGTHSDNMLDCSRKGRLNTARLFGTDNPASKLSKEAIMEIQSHPSIRGLSIPLSRKFGVAPFTIARTWRKQFRKVA